MKIKRIAAAALALLCFTGCSAKTAVPELNVGEQVEVKYDTAFVERGTVSQSEQYSGFVTKETESVMFKVSGNLAKNHVVVGQQVKKGDLIAELDTSDIDRQVAAAESQLSALRSVYANSLAAAESDLEIAEISQSLAESGKTAADTAVETAKTEKTAIQTELDTANAELEALLAALPVDPVAETAARDRIAQLETRLTDKEEEIAELEIRANDMAVSVNDRAYGVSRVKADIDYIKTNYGAQISFASSTLEGLYEKQKSAKIYAECDGTVVYIKPNTYGMWVAAYTDYATISVEGTEYVRYTGDQNLAASGARISAMIGGHEYNLEPMEYSEEEYIVFSLRGEVPPTRLALPESAKVEAGDYAHIIVHKGEAQNVLYIPINCLYTLTASTGYVYVIRDGMKVYTDVTYDFKNDVCAVITSGLQEGDELYVKQ